MPPRIAAGLPQVLSAGDAMLYRRIFAAIQEGELALADRLIPAVRDTRLIGYVQAARYLHPKGKPGYEQLVDWLRHYPQLADAPRIHQLARKLKPAKGGSRLPALATPPMLAGIGGDDESAFRDQPYRSRHEMSAETARLAAKLEAEVRAALKGNELGVAQSLLMVRHELIAEMDPVMVDRMRTDIAAALFYAGRDREALNMAGDAARSSKQLPMASWIAGLASWRLDRRGDALKFFEMTATSPAASSWTVAAASFWTARAHLTTRKPEGWARWMNRAAEFPYSFYGLLARRALGYDIAFDWELPPLGLKEIAGLQAHPAGMRALALLQIELRDQAEDELRRAIPKLSLELTRAALTLAERGGMPALALRLAARLAQSPGERYDAAFYPVPAWAPKSGFNVNRALLFAIARQESAFDSDARSPAGAMGLMQLMPGTVRAVALPEQAADTRPAKPDPRLLDPLTNLDSGQRYVALLLGHDRIQGNLLQMAAAYNGGTAAMLRWQDKALHQDDPLLFIESISWPETRLYVQRVLTNFWMYQLRLRQETTTLDAIAAGEWPVYTASEPGEVELAQDNVKD